MSDDRSIILDRLRQRERPFPDVPVPDTYLPVVPQDLTAPAQLTDRFITQAEQLGCQTFQVENAEAGLALLSELLAGETAVSCWELADIPLPGLDTMLNAAAISRSEAVDPTTTYGVSGVTAGLAATGSLVMASAPGQPRATSLLPPIHIAVMRANQIVPDLESWFAGQKKAGLAQLRQSSNVVVISGPSRTADIALEMVMGMHGPRELIVIILAS